MEFEMLMGFEPELIEYDKARHTIKGISIKDDKVLLLESNLGDYAFPGGGVELNESHYEALRREIIEETGYSCRIIGDPIGRIDLRRRDIFDENRMYELISHYYIIETSITQQEQCLTDGEMKFDLKPVWIDVDEAIRRNKISRLNGVGTEYWIDQELYVLQYIRDKMKDGGFGKDGVYRLASV